MPDGFFHEKGFFINSRSHRLFYQRWKAGNPSAALLLVHGVGEHSGRYEEFGKFLAEHGISVYTFDLVGYGQSEGRRGHIDSFSDFTSDVVLYAERVKQDLPENCKLFLFGHSLGALIALRTITCYDSFDFAGLALSGPPFRLSVSIPEWWKRFLIFLSHIIPGLRFKEASIKLNMLTHDEEKLNDFKKDPNRHYHRSLRFVREFFRNSKQGFLGADLIDVPLLIVQGGDDSIVDVRSVRDFYSNVTIEDKSLIIYPDMYHEVLNETDRSRVFFDIVSWIKKHD